MVSGLVGSLERFCDTVESDSVKDVLWRKEVFQLGRNTRLEEGLRRLREEIKGVFWKKGEGNENMWIKVEP